MLSTRILPTILNQTRRQFQTTGLRLASNALHVKSEDEFKKEVLDSKKAYVVDFHATWCGPCRVLEPRLEKVLNNYNKKVSTSTPDKQVRLAKVDIDELGELSGRYGVDAVPTVVAIKDGREISRFRGVADENRIEKMIEQLGR